MLSFNVRCAIQVLGELEYANRQGKRLTVTRLKALCGLEGRSVSVTISLLRKKHWVEQVNYEHYIIADLSHATLYDLVMAIDERLVMGCPVVVDSWPYKNRDKFTHVMELDERLAREMEQRLRMIPLMELLAREESTENKMSDRMRRRTAATQIVEGAAMFGQRDFRKKYTG